MTDLYIVDRETKKKIEEKVPYKNSLLFLYGNHPLAWLIRPLICNLPFVSKFFGYLQRRQCSAKHIAPFIEKYGVDSTEFRDRVDSFKCFNDFFIRKLKSSARAISDGNDIAVLPADGRYLAFQDIDHEQGIFIKGKKFSLETLLGDKKLALKYAQGSIVIARLAPVDYHRFHFPCNCIPSEPKLINGPLYSVNPIALKRNINILAENKRVITRLKTEHFGTMLFIEVGATYVGSIQETFEPNKHYAKGDEKGYFQFGGSSLILLFEPFRIRIDQDLIVNSHQGLETLGRMGQTLGRAISSL
jgi:phosphatidylserine decarboxylase